MSFLVCGTTPLQKTIDVILLLCPPYVQVDGFGKDLAVVDQCGGFGRERMPATAVFVQSFAHRLVWEGSFGLSCTPLYFLFWVFLRLYRSRRVRDRAR